MIKVQWFYKKQDLEIKKLGICDEDMEFIGENEVFPSKHFDRVFADAIVAKCQVYSIKEYDEIRLIDNITYFTRAQYCPLTHTLTPSYKQWERLCICQKPLNPNLLYIKCDDCGKWFHPKCMKLSNAEVDALDQFFCTNCNCQKSETKQGQDEA
jgi:hypothetical protein